MWHKLYEKKNFDFVFCYTLFNSNCSNFQAFPTYVEELCKCIFYSLDSSDSELCGGCPFMMVCTCTFICSNDSILERNFITCINWTNSLLINLLFQKSYCRLRMSESFGSVFSWFLNPTRILNSRIEKNIEKCFAIIFENAKQMHLHIDKFNSIFVSAK